MVFGEGADSLAPDDMAIMACDDQSGVCMAILGMLQRRWFDGLHREDDLQVLSELLEYGQYHRTSGLRTFLTV